MLLPCLALAACLGQASPEPARTNGPIYELRTYYAEAGRLDDLHARFRNHTVRLFKRHGITSLGYWTPVENPDNLLVYVVSYPSREARDRSFEAFLNDPEWQRAARQSEKDGPLVRRITSILMKPTDYSPNIVPRATRPPRLFELRTYHAERGMMDRLNARFRDHTVRLFRRHGIASVAYWTGADPERSADETLFYIVAHRDRPSAERAWKQFGADPQWRAARAASEKDGPLLAVPPSSVLLTPTDYSPTR